MPGLSGFIWCVDCEILWDPVGSEAWQRGEYECPKCHTIYVPADPKQSLGIPTFGYDLVKKKGKVVVQVGSPESRVTALVRTMLGAVG